MIEWKTLLSKIEILQHTPGRASPAPHVFLDLGDHDAPRGRPLGASPALPGNLARRRLARSADRHTRPLVAGGVLLSARHEPPSWLAVPRRRRWFPWRPPPYPSPWPRHSSAGLNVRQVLTTARDSMSSGNQRVDLPDRVGEAIEFGFWETYALSQSDTSAGHRAIRG